MNSHVLNQGIGSVTFQSEDPNLLDTDPLENASKCQSR